MKKIFKEAIFSLSVFSGITDYYRRIHKKEILIVSYHGVVGSSLEPFTWTQIHEAKLEHQLKYLKRQYSIMKLSEVAYSLEKSLELPDNAAVVTFDDGYKNNYTIAYPLLKRLRIPATIFLVTRYISTRTLCWHDVLYLGIKYSGRNSVDLQKYGLRFYPLRTAGEKQIAEHEIVTYLKSIPYGDKRIIFNEIMNLLAPARNIENNPFELLTWEEIKTMSADGLIEFGAHTSTHEILSQLDDKEVEREVTESCRTIQTHLEGRCLLFAYPNGRREDFNSHSKQVLKANGIKCAVSTIPGLNARDSDLFELRRASVGADISNARFKCLVSGMLFHARNYVCC